MAHTKARAIRAQKRAWTEPPPDDAPDDEPMHMLDGEPIDLRDAWLTSSPPLKDRDSHYWRHMSVPGKDI